MKRPIFVLAVLLLAWAPAGASAHGDRQVGDVEWVVGWQNEPTFVGFPNAVHLFLERGGAPVTADEVDLEVVVSLGTAQSDPFELRAAFGSPGEYLADIIPTTPGDYTFRFAGTIGDQEVDESWTASEDGFDQVHAPSELAFPALAPSTTELADRIDVLDERIEQSGGFGAALPISLVALALAAVAVARPSRAKS